MSVGHVYWRIQMGGYWFVVPHNELIGTVASAYQLKSWEVGIAVAALKKEGASTEMACARLLMGLAGNRPIRDNLGPAKVRVADEADVTLRPATTADLAQWERHLRVQETLKPGRGKKRAKVDQLGLGI